MDMHDVEAFILHIYTERSPSICQRGVFVEPASRLLEISAADRIQG